MGRIVVKSKKKVTHESETGSIKIGTRTTCQVTLRDPIAAEVHCEIRFTPQGFVIEDCGSSTGTYVNGLRVSGTQPLNQGDEIVLGVTKLVVELGRDGDLPVLELDLQEDKFFQKAKLSAGDAPTWIPGDREAFKEAEINFGAFPALRVTGWSAVAVAVLVLVVLAVPKIRGLILQPGPIHNLHAEEIEAGNCSACHLSSGDDGRAGCVLCHAELLSDRHPFSETVGFAVAEQACTRCHVEHLGTKTVEKPIEGSGGALVRVRDPKFVPANFTEVVACAECHRSGVPDEADARHYLESKRAEELGAESGSALASVRKPGRMERFSHAKHVGEKSIACDKCHLAGEGGGRDFAPVAFTTCMTCHHHEANRAYSPTEVIPDADWVAEAKPFRIDVHGQAALSAAGSGASEGDAEGENKCQLCHTSGSERRSLTFEQPVFLSSLTGEELPSGNGVPELYFSIQTRGHEGLTSSVDCAECHHKGTLASNTRPQRQFFHGLHLKELAVGAASSIDDSRAQALSGSCSECHAQTIAASSLGGEVFAEASCASCHGSANNSGGVPTVATPARTVTRERYDFPHALHVASTKGPLAKGCFACHEFQSDGDELLAAPVTPPEVSSCLGCHTDHQYTNRCSSCHSPTFQEEPFDALASASSFSHFEPGHAAMLSDCNRCHDGVASAEHVTNIGMPSTTDSACFECHFERRFHWR